MNYTHEGILIDLLNLCFVRLNICSLLNSKHKGRTSVKIPVAD